MFANRALIWPPGRLCAFVAVSAAIWIAPRASSAAERATKGPYLTGLSDTSTTVRFELEKPAAASVEVVMEGEGDAGADGGRRTAAKSVVQSRAASTLHVVPITGLQPGTTYRYTVVVGGSTVGAGRFSTAPKADSEAALSFLVYGDDRTDHPAHAAVVRAMMAVHSDFVVQTGDMVQDGGSATDWQTFFDIEAPLLQDHPIFAAIGNHELYDDASGGNFAHYFGFSEAPGGPPLPYGTVRISNARFFFLNGMHGWDSGEEREWLERALARADNEAGVTWRFAVVHSGPWSSGPHGPNVQLVSAHVPELLAAHKIDLVFAGHDHLYERGDSGLTKYIISGGGGAPLYKNWKATPSSRKVEAVHHFVEVSTSADALRIVSHRVDGSVIERCGFVKGGPWDCDTAALTTASPPSAPTSGEAGTRPAHGDPPAAAGAAKACACDTLGSPSRSPEAWVTLALGWVGLGLRRRGRLAG